LDICNSLSRDSQVQWEVQSTEFATRAGKFTETSAQCYTQQNSIVP